MQTILDKIQEISGQASAMEAAVLTILGVLVVIGIAYAIVRGLRS